MILRVRRNFFEITTFPSSGIRARFYALMLCTSRTQVSCGRYKSYCLPACHTLVQRYCERQGIKASSLLMMIYAVFTFTILMSASDKISLLFVDASETEILKNTVLFLHVSCYFFPILGLLCILRYTIQGAGYTNLAMLSGVSEMIARTLVSIYAVPIFGFLAVCFGDPTAWIAADLFLVPAFIYVYRKLKKSLKENYAIPNSSTSNSSVE